MIVPDLILVVSKAEEVFSGSREVSPARDTEGLHAQVNYEALRLRDRRTSRQTFDLNFAAG